MKEVREILKTFCKTQTFRPHPKLGNEAMGQAFEKKVLNYLRKRLPDHQYIKIEDIYPKAEIEIIFKQISDPHITSYLCKNRGKFITYQPFGGNPPDILVIGDGTFYPIECKSSRRGRVEFGRANAKKGIDYVFANCKADVILQLHCGVNFEHCSYDPVIIKLMKEMDVTRQKMSTHLKKTRYKVLDGTAKYICKSTTTFPLAKEIK